MSIDAPNNLSPSTIDRLFALFDRAERQKPQTIAELHRVHSDFLSQFVRIVEPVNGAAVWLIDRGEPVLQSVDAESATEASSQSSRLAQQQAEVIDELPDHDIVSHVGNSPPTILVKNVLCAGQCIVTRLVLNEQSTDELDEACSTLGQMLADDYTSVLLGRLYGFAQQRQQLSDFVHSLHGHQKSDDIALDLANDGAIACDADRICFVQLSRGKARLVAATSAIAIERRAEMVADIENFAEQLAVAQTDDRQEQLVTDYSAKFAAQETLVDWLGDDRRNGALLIADQFQDRPLNADAFDEIVRHGRLALSNSNQRKGRGSLKRLFANRHAFMALAALAIAALALVFVPTDFYVNATGQLQPVQQQIGFAPDDGMIAEVMFKDSDEIGAGTKLLRISNSRLMLQEETIAGDSQTVAAQLASVQAARRDPRRNVQKATPEQLTAEEEELKKRQQSLQRQLKIIRDQLDQLTLTADIDGVVRRTDLQSELFGQPVKRGQPLFNIVKPDGDWNLELRVPDRSLRHVLKMLDSDKDVPVTFRIVMSPENQWEESITTVSPITDLDQSGRLSALALASINNDIPGCRPGAGVDARIYCGRRSLGYVWFREMIEFVQMRFF